ncbi:DUF924 family protein [Crenobacter cavernae]|uniref:DUF924 domain-containing protein n=1 Tax=Crenobacter cavernae TaxID=2290923 RepID=A0A345Y719_9NEIS|nr:DUF924 family protein [Crenobacter cavernae]AXK39721.1 DUF924 domain-containing protein [Crenobacter cavernae]
MDDWVNSVLECWFGGSDEASLSAPRDAWFRKDDAFDAELRERFLGLWQSMTDGERLAEADSPRAALAQLIVLDQFPRNLFRGDARAFASDAAARQLAKHAVAEGWDEQLPPVARWFVYLPFEHSEDLADQHKASRLFEALPDGSPGYAGVIDYAHRHRDIVARFGRFPHRNAVLGRPDTPEEAAFLEQPGSSF